MCVFERRKQYWQIRVYRSYCVFLKTKIVESLMLWPSFHEEYRIMIKVRQSDAETQHWWYSWPNSGSCVRNSRNSVLSMSRWILFLPVLCIQIHCLRKLESGSWNLPELGSVFWAPLWIRIRIQAFSHRDIINKKNIEHVFYNNLLLWRKVWIKSFPYFSLGGPGFVLGIRIWIHKVAENGSLTLFLWTWK